MYGGEVNKGFCLGNVRERDNLERHRHRWEDNIKIDLHQNWDVGTWTGYIWLRIGTGGGLM
jgi:hypothetical protein